MKKNSESFKELWEEIRKAKEDNEAVSLGEACEILGISRTTLYVYIKSGLIAKVMQGKSPKILLTEIKRYLNS